MINGWKSTNFSQNYFLSHWTICGTFFDKFSTSNARFFLTETCFYFAHKSTMMKIPIMVSMIPSNKRLVKPLDRYSSVFIEWHNFTKWTRSANIYILILKYWFPYWLHWYRCQNENVQGEFSNENLRPKWIKATVENTKPRDRQSVKYSFLDGDFFTSESSSSSNWWGLFIDIASLLCCFGACLFVCWRCHRELVFKLVFERISKGFHSNFRTHLVAFPSLFCRTKLYLREISVFQEVFN